MPQSLTKAKQDKKSQPRDPKIWRRCASGIAVRCIRFVKRDSDNWICSRCNEVIADRVAGMVPTIECRGASL